MRGAQVPIRCRSSIQIHVDWESSVHSWYRLNIPWRPFLADPVHQYITMHSPTSFVIFIIYSLLYTVMDSARQCCQSWLERHPYRITRRRVYIPIILLVLALQLPQLVACADTAMKAVTGSVARDLLFRCLIQFVCSVECQ